MGKALYFGIIDCTISRIEINYPQACVKATDNRNYLM